MIVKLLTERHFEFLSLKEGCIRSSESALVKMSNCWKSHAAAHMIFTAVKITLKHVDIGDSDLVFWYWIFYCKLGFTNNLEVKLFKLIMVTFDS